MERRTLEVRAAVEGNRLIGHPAVFDQETYISGWDFYEVINSRAFDKVLREDQDVVLQVDHAGMPLARTRAGNLRLGKDSVGLTMEADLPDTSLARDVRELAAAGVLTSMSFGFTVAVDAWSRRKDGGQLRSVEEVGRLFDVSVVTFPAYSGTDVALRSRQFGDAPKIPARGTARGQAALIRARNQIGRLS